MNKLTLKEYDKLNRITNKLTEWRNRNEIKLTLEELVALKDAHQLLCDILLKRYDEF